MKGNRIFWVLLLASCFSGPSYVDIPLEELQADIRKKGSTIAADVITSFTDPDGAGYLMNRSYSTPKLKALIGQNSWKFAEAYEVLPLSIGKLKSYHLFGARKDRGLWILRYRLVTDRNDLQLVELRLELNKLLELATYSLRISSKDGSLSNENVLPYFVE